MNNFRIGTLQACLRNNEEFSTINEYDQMIDSLTPEILHQAAKKYLNYDTMKLFIGMPEK